MKRIRIFFILLVATVSLQGLTAQEAEIDLPQVKGWKIIREYPVYYPDNLWDYINGAADAYLSYDFTDLHIAEYKKGRKRTVKVELYHHRTPVHAYGMYTQERAPEFHFVDVGAEGYQEGTTLNFVAGEYYVKIVSNEQGKALEQFILDLARRISDAITPNPETPEALQLFPAENRLPKSETFIARNFLGYEFFSGVYAASYQDAAGNRYTLFFTRKEKPRDCLQILEKYYQAVGQEYQMGEDHRIEDPYNGLVAMKWKGNFLWGIMGLKDEGTAARILDGFSPAGKE